MTYLFILAVGPVQEFIATARRSRDLWFGSWLLSELAKAAAHRLVVEHNNNLDCLIFPRPETLEDLNGTNQSFSVPNKIVALVTTEPKVIGKRIGESLLKRLESIRDNAFQNMDGKKFELDKAEAQVNDLLEYFWAAVPLEDPQNPIEYQKARKQVEALLAARKTTREFSQPSWASNVPKSSLDGLRESVIPESAYALPNADAEQRRQIAYRLWLNYRVREGERLCGVGLLKRHGNRGNDDSFFSTSHVAALPLMARFKEADRAEIENYINVIQSSNQLDRQEKRQALGHVSHSFDYYDGHLLFAERLPELIGEDASRKPLLELAKQALRRLLDKTLGKSRSPLPYYALLHADGDRMGKAIDAQKSITAHQKLSSQLTAFARGVKKIVESHKGSLVYAGGDDVLAFLPLHTVLACARELADTFRKQMAEFEIKEQDQMFTPTLSVGIAITHHIEPLADALQLARAAEKKAKQIEGKDALAITLSKRSGVDRTVSAKWGTLDQRLDLFIALHRLDLIPDGAAYEFKKLSLDLSSVPKAIQPEAERILKRKRAKRGEEEIQKTIVTKVLEGNTSITALADELIIAGYLAQATEQAGIPPEELPGYLQAKQLEKVA